MASSRCCWFAIRPKSSPGTVRVPAKPVAWSPFIGLTPGVTSRSYSLSLISKSDVTWSSPTVSTSAWNPAEPVVRTYCGWTPVSPATVSAMSCGPPRGRPSLIFEGSPSNSTRVSLGIPTAAAWPVSKFKAISSMASALPSESEPRASTTTTSSSPKSTPVDSSTFTRLNRVGAVCESGTSSSRPPTASAAKPRRSLLMTRSRRSGRRCRARSRRSSTRRRGHQHQPPAQRDLPGVPTLGHVEREVDVALTPTASRPGAKVAMLGLEPCRLDLVGVLEPRSGDLVDVRGGLPGSVAGEHVEDFDEVVARVVAQESLDDVRRQHRSHVVLQVVAYLGREPVRAGSHRELQRDALGRVAGRRIIGVVGARRERQHARQQPGAAG